MNFAVNYPAPFKPTEVATKIVNAECASYAKAYIMWLFNVTNVTVTECLNSAQTASIVVDRQELISLGLVK